MSSFRKTCPYASESFQRSSVTQNILFTESLSKQILWKGAFMAFIHCLRLHSALQKGNVLKARLFWLTRQVYCFVFLMLRVILAQLTPPPHGFCLNKSRLCRVIRSMTCFFHSLHRSIANELQQTSQQNDASVVMTQQNSHEVLWGQKRFSRGRCQGKNR